MLALGTTGNRMDECQTICRLYQLLLVFIHMTEWYMHDYYDYAVTGKLPLEMLTQFPVLNDEIICV